MSITPERIQEMIEAAPAEHHPALYECYVKDKRDNYIDKRYVRARSPRRAELLAVKVSRFIFSQAKADRAHVIMKSNRNSAYAGWTQ